MADELFLMQRYWGSEDENSADSGDALGSTTVSPTKVQKSYDNQSTFEHSKEDLVSNLRYWGSDDENSADSDNAVGSTNVSPIKNSDFENETLEPKKKRKKIHLSERNEMEVESDHIPLKDEKEKKIDEPPNGLKSPKISKSKKKKSKSEKLKNSKNNTEPGAPTDDLVLPTSENCEENFQVIGQIKSKSDEKVKPTLPKWLSNPTIFGIDLHGQETPISELSYLDDCSKKNLENAGIKFLFPVQLSVIPWLMQSNQGSLSVRPSDLCVSAPTGSGKTLAYVLPIVQSLKTRIVCSIRAIVVLPVSELAIQVYKVFETFVRGTDLKVILMTGKKSFTSEQKNLVRKGIRRTLSLVDIIVTTPGRLLDHIYRTEGFCLQQLRYLVIDEADGMMYTIQSGWLKAIEESVYHDYHRSNCVCYQVGGRRLAIDPSSACSLGYINYPLQKLLYSATLSHDPEKLHTLSLYKPKLFTAQAESDDWIGKCTIPESLTLQAIICKSGTKPLVLCHYLKTNQFKKVLCFMESVERAQRLHFILAEMGIEAREITSNNRPIQRKIVLEQFSSGKINLLVCSDMVARGIDIEDVDCVISYDVPTFLKTYVHRIGRTARAGKKGVGVTLLSPGEKIQFFKHLETVELTLPELLPVEDRDLEIYVDSYKKALSVADSKLKKVKNEHLTKKLSDRQKMVVLGLVKLKMDLRQKALDKKIK